MNYDGAEGFLARRKSSRLTKLPKKEAKSNLKVLCNKRNNRIVQDWLHVYKDRSVRS